MQSSFFDLDNRYQKLDERDALLGLNRLIDWEDFRTTLSGLEKGPRKGPGGRPRFDVVLMFKVLILQQLYNFSDDELEYQIRDRYSFSRFLGLAPEDRVPDAKTIWLFREQLTQQGLIEELFADFDLQLDEKGFKAQKGQIVDATIVRAPRQRNSREENQQIKAGEIPERFKEKPAVGRQKDTDARWTKKHNERHYGYKNHVNVDVKNKLIRRFEVTSAEVHDSQVFYELLTEDNARDVWADSAYAGEESELQLSASGYRSRVHRKGKRNRPLTDRQQASNRKKSRIRARVEHVFGSMENEQGGLLIRVIGLVRVKAKVGLMNLVYNMRRLVTLCRQCAPEI